MMNKAARILARAAVLKELYGSWEVRQRVKEKTMDKHELKTKLAELLDERSIVAIIDTLAVLCEEKAESAKRYEQIGAGTRWQRRSEQLSRLAATMEEEKARYG